MPKYLFKSERLGFRNWQENDLEELAAINADPQVMEFFPSTQSKEKTRDFIGRMQNLFSRKGHCYFAVEELATREFIGFIGLGEQTFEASFTPCIDIGWRLAKRFWGQGYATEGAKRVLQFAFQNLGLSEINSIASISNVKSTNVMKKIGMQKILVFEHPILKDYPELIKCVFYQKKKS